MFGFVRRQASSREAVSGDYAEQPLSHRAPERPPLPKPERINRSALTIVAVIMGTLVIATVVFLQPNRPAPADQRVQPATAPVLPQGTYLDQPIRRPAGSDLPGLTPGMDSVFGSGPAGSGQKAGSSANTHAVAPGVPDPSLFPPGVQPSGLTAVEDRRTRAFEAALVAPVFASEIDNSAGANLARPDWDFASGGELASAAALPARTSDDAPAETPRISTFPILPSAGLPADRPARLAGSNRPTTIRTSVEPAPGPYAIQAGTLIPAVLLTGIDSDLPGDVLAQVARDVYDSRSMQRVLVPKGSKLIGRYEDQVGVGQDRLLIAWTRIVFPDGRSVTLPGLETKDRTGAGGLRDKVDRHTGRVFGTATLLSLIGAGLQLSQPQGGATPFGSYPSPQQVAAAAVGQELAQVATQMLRRDLEIRPTIRIRQGMPFNVFFNADLAFDEPYLARR